VRVILRLLSNLLRVIAMPLWAVWVGRARARVRWVQLRLDGSLTELPVPRVRGLARYLPLPHAARASVWQVRKLVDQLEAHKGPLGLFVEIGSLHAGFATLESLRRELERLKATDKRVVAYLPYGGQQREMLVASVAHSLWLSPPATLTLLGPSVSRTYLKPLLDRLGIEVQVTAEGDYKTAAEALARDRMSAPEREQLGAIVHALQARLLEALSHRTAAAGQGATEAFAQGLVDASRCTTLGLTDDALYEDEVYARLGLEKGRRPTRTSRYRRLRPRRLLLPLAERPRVIVLRLEGVIGQRSAGTGIDPRTTTAVVRELARRDDVAGVIVYLNSPGGSALDSDLLYREVGRLATKKPVVAWLGDVAASGGYYLAAAAPHIVAGESTLTGSIGVISVRPVAARLFERLGLHREVVKEMPHADLFDLSRAPTDPERQALSQEAQRFYERFLDAVATGRRMSVDEVRRVAGGRVWIGSEAKTQGLVDQLGGYHEARAALDELLLQRGIRAERDASVLTPPRLRVTPPAPIETLLSGFSALAEPLLALRTLIELTERGERVLTYALELADLTDR
jgi:protease-4